MAVPTLVSAEAIALNTGNKVKVTFSVPVTAVDITGVTAKINGNAVVVIGQIVDNSEDIVYILALPALAGDVVLISIAVTVNTITAVTGGESFVSATDQAVTNNSYLTTVPINFLGASQQAQTATIIAAKVVKDACQDAC